MLYRPADIPPEAEAHLAPAFARSDVLDGLEWLQRCRDDLAQLHRAGDFWAITEVLDTRQGRAVHIVAAAGAWNARLVPEIESWARTLGCERCFFTGRPGWMRRMADYRLRTVTLERKL